MAYAPNAMMAGSDRGQARAGHAQPRTFNNAWSDPMNPGQVAFGPFGQHDQQQQQQSFQASHQQQPPPPPPNLNLNTRMPGPPFESQQDNATTPTPFGADAINNWAAADEPWSGAHYSVPRLDTTVGPGNQQYQPFAVPRSPAHSASTASAIGARHIDSAYGSNPSPNTYEPTTAGSDMPEFTGLFGKMPSSYSTSMENHTKSSRRGPSFVPSNTDEHNITVPDDGKCTFCPKEFRLKSELKKHMLRHTRPFRCFIPGCNGSSEGFTTSNDLDRHNRSVHNIFPKGAKVYICAAKDCAEGEKTWPRYDNFKQHCERMHKSESLDSLIRRSERAAPSPAPEVQQYLPEYNKKPGAGRKRSAVSDTASLPPREPPAYHNLHGQGREDAFYRYPTSDADSASFSGYRGTASDLGPDYQGVRQIQRQGRGFQGRRAGPGDSASMTSSRAGQHRPGSKNPQIIIHQEPRPGHELSHMSYNQPQTESPVEYFHDGNETPNHPRAQSMLTPDLARSRSVSSQSSAVSAHSQASRGRAATISGGDASRSSFIGKRKQEGAASNSKRVRCKWPGCGKADMRPCELKKHERRHSRPFGCTFDFCHKAFGSKNDWKRHESSQHFQDEMWRCAQPYQPSVTTNAAGILTLSQSDCETSNPCALAFYEQGEFANHLVNQHNFTEATEITQVCEEQRIGRNLCESFWCGFCKKVIPLVNEGRKGWDERFDHIGTHFHPQNKNIKDWTPPIGNKTKGEMLAEKQHESVYESESRSDVDAVGDSEAPTSAYEEAIVSPVDASSFPSPSASFGAGTMAGIEFAGMGMQNLPVENMAPPQDMNETLTLDTSAGATFGSAMSSGFVTGNGQLPSPAASMGQDPCSASSASQDRRRRRHASPEEILCCNCGYDLCRGSDMDRGMGAPCGNCFHHRCEQCSS